MPRSQRGMCMGHGRAHDKHTWLFKNEGFDSVREDEKVLEMESGDVFNAIKLFTQKNGRFLPDEYFTAIKKKELA